MRPLRFKCFSCISTLQKVKVPKKNQKHIIKKHYPKRKHWGQSTFFKRFITPQRLFYEVRDVLRSGIKWSEKQSRFRYVYYYTFAFKVGIFRNGHGGFSSATETVKIVCDHIECAKCGRHWPSKVATIYPYIRKKTAKIVRFSSIDWEVDRPAGNSHENKSMSNGPFSSLKIPARCSLGMCWIFSNFYWLWLTSTLSVITQIA